MDNPARITPTIHRVTPIGHGSVVEFCDPPFNVDLPETVRERLHSAIAMPDSYTDLVDRSFEFPAFYRIKEMYEDEQETNDVNMQAEDDE